MRKIKKYDNLIYGLIPGILLPVITFLIIWRVAYHGSLIDYYRQFRELNRLSGLVSLSAMSNLLLFFISIWLNMYRTARGVVFATIILALLMLILKYI